jgi:hypothetical protein
MQEARRPAWCVVTPSSAWHLSGLADDFLPLGP